MNKGQLVAYVRVSTVEQNEGRQLKALEHLNIDKIYIEKASAKNTDRPQLKALLDFVRTGDTIYIQSFDRLARSTKDLLDITEQLKTKGVKLISLKEALDTGTPQGKLMLTMLAAINEFERANLLERQKEGIAIAKAEGKYKGRKKIKYPDNWEEVYNQWKNRKIKGNQAMDLLNLKRNTFYKLLKEYEIK